MQTCTQLLEQMSPNSNNIMMLLVKEKKGMLPADNAKWSMAKMPMEIPSMIRSAVFQNKHKVLVT